MFMVMCVDGPLAGGQFGLAARALPEILWTAPMPEGIAGVVDNWIIIGTDTAPPLVPIEGMTSYVFERTASLLEREDDGEGLAIYTWSVTAER